MSLEISYSVTSTTIKASIEISGSVQMYVDWYIAGNHDGRDSLAQGATSASHTFKGLKSGTCYFVSVSVYGLVDNAWEKLDSGSANIIPNSAGNPTERYYASLRIVDRGSIIRYSGGNEWSAKGYADIGVEYWTNENEFWAHDGTFLGYDEDQTKKIPTYGKSGTVTIRAYSTSSNSPTELTFYTIHAWRPSDWYWTNESSMVAGQECYLQAYDWNKFITRIEDFAWFKQITLNKTNIAAAKATQGSRMLASQANAARSLISQLGSTVATPAAVKSGDVIKASFIIGLKDALNGVPENPNPYL